MALEVAYPRQVEAEQTVLPDFGQNIINAFAHGAAINQKARDLKNDMARIALLEKAEAFKEQTWPAEYAQKERQIKGEADWRRQRMDLDYKEYQSLDKYRKGQLNKAGGYVEGLDQYAGTVAALDDPQSATYAPKGTKEWQTGFDKAGNDFYWLQSYPGYKRVHDMAWNEHKAARDAMVKQDSFTVKNYRDTANSLMRRGGYTPYDLTQPETVWGHGKDADGNPTRWLAFAKKGEPNEYQIVLPEVVNKYKTADQETKFDFRTIDGEDYDHYRDLESQAQEIINRPTNRSPADTGTVPQTKSLDATTARQIYEEAGRDPVRAREIAKQRGYSL
jgi:hypothetical protein